MLRNSATPDIFDSGVRIEDEVGNGVASAVKKIRLESPMRMEISPGTAGSGRGTVRSNEMIGSYHFQIR